MASGRTGGASRTPTKNSSSPASAKAAAKASAGAARSGVTKPTAGAKGSDLTPQQKVQAMRRKAARKQRRGRILLVAALVVVVAGAGTGIGLYYGLRKDPLANVKTYTNTRNHTTAAVTYAQTPPTGGDHNPVWLNCGVYSTPVKNENAVHDLEHGAVWITYRPDLPQSEIDELVNKVTGQTYETLSPYPGLPAPVVVSSWDHQLRLTGPNDPGLDAFIKKYKQNPKTTPEPGALCTGGTGTPIG